MMVSALNSCTTTFGESQGHGPKDRDPFLRHLMDSIDPILEATKCKVQFLHPYLYIYIYIYITH